MGVISSTIAAERAAQASEQARLDAERVRELEALLRSETAATT